MHELIKFSTQGRATTMTVSPAVAMATDAPAVELNFRHATAITTTAQDTVSGAAIPAKDAPLQLSARDGRAR
jgi:hypothetical protein